MAKVLKEEDEEGNLEVSYYRKSDEAHDKFVLPLVPDLKSIHSNVKEIFPIPRSGGRARQKNMISFQFDFSCLRMG